jgi:hypothetical protein
MMSMYDMIDSDYVNFDALLDNTFKLNADFDVTNTTYQFQHNDSFNDILSYDGVLNNDSIPPYTTTDIRKYAHEECNIFDPDITFPPETVSMGMVPENDNIFDPYINHQRGNDNTDMVFDPDIPCGDTDDNVTLFGLTFSMCHDYTVPDVGDPFASDVADPTFTVPPHQIVCDHLPSLTDTVSPYSKPQYTIKPVIHPYQAKLLEFIGAATVSRCRFMYKIPVGLPSPDITTKIIVDNSSQLKSICQQHLISAINQCCPLFAIGAYGQSPESIHPFNILGAKHGHNITLVLYSFLTGNITTSRIVNDGAHILRQVRGTGISQFQLQTKRKVMHKNGNASLPKSRLSIRDYLRIYPSYDSMKNNKAVKLPSIFFSHREYSNVKNVQDFINGRGPNGWFVQLFKKPVAYNISNMLPPDTGKKVTIEDSKLRCKTKFTNGRRCACVDIIMDVISSDISHFSRLDCMVWLSSLIPSSSTRTSCDYPVDYKTIAYFPYSQHRII